MLAPFLLGVHAPPPNATPLDCHLLHAGPGTLRLNVIEQRRRIPSQLPLNDRFIVPAI